MRLAGFVMLMTLMYPAWGLDALGPTYPIQERDMIEAIKARLESLKRSGRLGELEKEAIARSRRSVEQPRAVAGLTATRMPRTFYFDPSMRVPRDVVTPTGQVLARAGDRINPLDHIQLSNHLVFFDQRDPRQVAKASALIGQYKGAVKPILVGGEPFKLMKAWKRQVFFDQGGTLVRRFGIRQVPALVSQDVAGKRIRIDELEVR